MHINNVQVGVKGKNVLQKSKIKKERQKERKI